MADGLAYSSSVYESADTLSGADRDLDSYSGRAACYYIVFQHGTLHV